MLLNFPCCVARRGAVKERGTPPAEESFCWIWVGLDIVKRAAIALVTCAVAALFARRAKIRWLFAFLGGVRDFLGSAIRPHPALTRHLPPRRGRLFNGCANIAILFVRLLRL